MVKTWKVREDAIAGMQVGPKSATVAIEGSGDVNGLYVDESGTYLRGKMSIMCMPESIRVGGFWRQKSAWRQMLGSNLANYNPNLEMSPPVSGITDMAEAVAWMMGLLV